MSACSARLPGTRTSPDRTLPCTARTSSSSSLHRAQAERDAALWLLACVLALWTPPEPEHAWQPGLGLPHEDAAAHMPRVDDLLPLYGMMRQVRAAMTFLLPLYIVSEFMQARMMQGLGLLGRQQANCSQVEARPRATSLCSGHQV